MNKPDKCKNSDYGNGKLDWLWRLNDWVGDHYTMWWAKEGRKL